MVSPTSAHERSGVGHALNERTGRSEKLPVSGYHDDRAREEKPRLCVLKCKC